MGFVAPLWLAAAGLVGAGVLVAHLFSTTVPPQDVLPTVRFIPESTPLTVMRSRRVSDWVLFVLRLTIVALLGLALSGAHVPRSAPRRVVLLDASRAVASITAAKDTAVAEAGGEPIIVFDSTARRISVDSARRLTLQGGRGSLSAGEAAAHLLLAPYSEGRDKTELVIVSPLAREEVDAVTEHLLSLWEGPVRFIQVAAAAVPAPLSTEVRATGDDPVAVAAGYLALRGPAGVRVVRNGPTAADSQWASRGGALVVWPAANEVAVLKARAVPDSQGGVIADGHAVIASMRRAFEPRPGKAVARWVDGAPAATESEFGQGCIREVAIPVDAVGDIALRESFRSVVRSLLTPCGGTRDFRPAALSRKHLAGAGPSAPSAGSLPLVLALLAAALLGVEHLLRRRAGSFA